MARDILYLSVAIRKTLKVWQKIKANYTLCYSFYGDKPFYRSLFHSP